MPDTHLVSLGYRGSYGRVAAFVRAWKAERQREAQTSGRGTFVPLLIARGEAFQSDWSEDWAALGGGQVKLQVAHTNTKSARRPSTAGARSPVAGGMPFHRHDGGAG